MSNPDASSSYGRFYYASYFSLGDPEAYERSARWLQFFGHIAARIVSDINPKTALDAGCAMGMLVESLRDLGVEAYGIDISEYALATAREDIREHCVRASVTDPLPRHYDLITCIETLEHLEPRDGEEAVANLCAHTDDVIFSSTPAHFKEATHLNVRGVEYWAELFARHGLHRDVDYDLSGYIAPWAIRFRRRGDSVSRVVANYERVLWRLATENRELRELSQEQQAVLADRTSKVESLTAQRDAASAELTSASAQLEAATTAARAADTHVAMIKRTRTYRLAKRFELIGNRLLPPGSRRRSLWRPRTDSPVPGQRP